MVKNTSSEDIEMVLVVFHFKQVRSLISLISLVCTYLSLIKNISFWEQASTFSRSDIVLLSWQSWEEPQNNVWNENKEIASKSDILCL